MAGWQMVIMIAAGAALALAAGAGGTSYLCPARPGGPSVDEIKRRVDAEKRRPRPSPVARPEMWPLGWPHEAPETPFSVDAAHAVMQQHRHCGLDRCARKRAAFRVLVQAGHAVPDPRADKYLHDEEEPGTTGHGEGN
ncbi:hypothetical protein ACQP2U_43480 (plasmid) [Nocardia sp. CA-084685]|uniref:hypothetical protein n=1 Tax=Nocardia sp. CA-084685 TaxID=3239970 RepID=UPI003D96F46E